MELSFKTGQLLHVIKRADNFWYQAYDPLSQKQGYVPAELVNVVWNEEKSATATYPSTRSTTPPTPVSKGETSEDEDEYASGTVLYDFVATNQYELDAKAGDQVIVYDSSDPDWLFVKKKENEKMGQKLIPRSYVGLMEDLVATDVSTVYSRRSSFSSYRGTLESNSSDKKSTLERQDTLTMRPQLDTGFTARVIDYVRLPPDSEWTFILQVTRLPSKTKEIIYRTYQEFYMLHMTLLRLFPGQENGRRVIPFMPGPEKFITPSLADQRTYELDGYVQELCDLSEDIRSTPEYAHFFAYRPESDGPERLLQLNKNNRDWMNREPTPKPQPKPDAVKRCKDAAIVDDRFRKLSTQSDDQSYTKQRKPGLFKAKILCGDDKIALRISLATRYADFRNKVFQKFELSPRKWHQISYVDEDGDIISVHAEEDFITALRTCPTKKITFYVQ